MMSFIIRSAGARAWAESRREALPDRSAQVAGFVHIEGYAFGQLGSYCVLKEAYRPLKKDREEPHKLGFYFVSIL